VHFALDAASGDFTVTPLRRRFVEDLQVRNYSPRTVECYVFHVGRFAQYFGRSPDQLGPEEVRAYQVYLAREKQASRADFNQAVCALRFLYRVTRPREWPVAMIPFAKKPKKLPTVLATASRTAQPTPVAAAVDSPSDTTPPEDEPQSCVHCGQGRV